MPESQEKNNESQDKFSKDNLALIIGGIFVLALIFAAYSYFNRNSDLQDRIQKNTDRIQDIISSNTTGDEEKSEEESGTDTTPTPTPNGEDRKETIGNGSNSNAVTGTVWTANDYQQGDIKGNTYTVVSGDTLWEIAEAVYGNGSQWTKILDANSSNVGYLPNGQQALIVPGQVLVLP